MTDELGKGYNVSSLKRMRKFFVLIQKGATLSHQLTWSHYVELLKLNSETKINYYVYIIKKFNISIRELRKRIKSKEYERIGYKEELKKPKVTTLIKNPIIIKTGHIIENINEYTLHQLILEDMPNFLKELGIGFSFIDHEYKIKIAGNYHSIDFLLFNYKFNCFIVVEIKASKMAPEYIGQITKYINYVNKHVKENHNDNTVGIVICKKDNKYVMEYCSNPVIFTTTYKLKSI